MSNGQLGVITRFEFFRLLKSAPGILFLVFFGVVYVFIGANLSESKDRLERDPRYAAAADALEDPDLASEEFAEFNPIYQTLSWILDLDEREIARLVKKHPLLLFALFAMTLMLVPALVLILAMDQTGMDISRRHARYLVVRANRTSIYVGKTLAVVLFWGLSALIGTLAMAIICQVTGLLGEGVSVTSQIPYILRIFGSIFLLGLPFIALAGPGVGTDGSRGHWGGCHFRALDVRPAGHLGDRHAMGGSQAPGLPVPHAPQVRGHERRHDQGVDRVGLPAWLCDRGVCHRTVDLSPEGPMSTESPVVVETRGLTKTYGKIQALRGLDLTVHAGRITGIVGPNGAGKTTLFGILCGYLRPTSGTVRLGGAPVTVGQRPPIRVSTYPQDALLLEGLTVKSHLKYYARLDGISKDRAENEASRVLHMVKLPEVWERMPKTLSHGQRKRVGIAQAFFGEPDLVILDEPTAGLDPASARQVRAAIRQVAENRTVLVSSHDLDQVQELCAEAVIIDRGQVARTTTMAALASTSGKVSFKLVQPPGDETLAMVRAVSFVQGAHWDKVDGRLRLVWRHHHANRGRGRQRTGATPGPTAACCSRSCAWGIVSLTLCATRPGVEIALSPG